MWLYICRRICSLDVIFMLCVSDLYFLLAFIHIISICENFDRKVASCDSASLLLLCYGSVVAAVDISVKHSRSSLKESDTHWIHKYIVRLDDVNVTQIQ